MEIVPSATGSGLLIAVEGADERNVGALLRRHDPDLRLVPRFSEEHGCKLWMVYRWKGPNDPSEFVCAWQTRDGQPLPLSSNVVEMVQLLDRGTVGAAPDPDASNAALRARRKKDSLETKQAIADDHKPYIDRKRYSMSRHGKLNRETFGE